MLFTLLPVQAFNIKPGVPKPPSGYNAPPMPNYSQPSYVDQVPPFQAPPMPAPMDFGPPPTSYAQPMSYAPPMDFQPQSFAPVRSSAAKRFMHPTACLYVSSCDTGLSLINSHQPRWTSSSSLCRCRCP